MGAGRAKMQSRIGAGTPQSAGWGRLRAPRAKLLARLDKRLHEARHVELLSRAFIYSTRLRSGSW